MTDVSAKTGNDVVSQQDQITYIRCLKMDESIRCSLQEPDRPEHVVVLSWKLTGMANALFDFLRDRLPLEAFPTIEMEYDHVRNLQAVGRWAHMQKLVFSLDGHKYGIETQWANTHTTTSDPSVETTLFVTNPDSIPHLFAVLNRYTRSVVLNDGSSHISAEQQQAIRPLRVLCYNKNSGFWPVVNKQFGRTFNSIALDPAVKSTLINRLTDYVSSEHEYIVRNLRYHFCIVLHGVPGNGKTSVAHAIATFTRRDVHLLSFDPSWDNAALLSAMKTLPPRALVVCEDADALFVGRGAGEQNRSAVSFSTVLNALDGFYAPHDLIFILTTSRIDHFDDAMMRPGRVDLKLEIKKPSAALIRWIVQRDAPQLSPEKQEQLITHMDSTRQRPTMAAITAFLFTIRHETELINDLFDAFDAMSHTTDRETRGII